MSDLNTAIAEAAEELTKKIDPLGTKTGEEEVVQEGDEQQSDDEPDQEDPAEQDLAGESLEEAKRLYKALSDPVKGPQVLKALAFNAGLLSANLPETKKEEKVAKKAIVDVLAEKLGPEAKFLAPKIGEALEEIFQQEREEQQAQFQQIQIQNTEREVVEITKKLNQETKGGYAKLEGRLEILATEIPIGPGMTIEKYLRYLYAIASSEANKTVSPKTLANKIRQNANDLPSRLRTSSATGGPGDQVPDKKMNLKESIKWASDQLTKGK